MLYLSHHKQVTMVCFFHIENVPSPSLGTNRITMITFSFDASVAIDNTEIPYPLPQSDCKLDTKKIILY